MYFAGLAKSVSMTIDNPFRAAGASIPLDMHSVAVGIGHRKIAGDSIVVFTKSDLETLRGDVVVGNKTNGNGVAAAVVDTARTRRESADLRPTLRATIVD